MLNKVIKKREALAREIEELEEEIEERGKKLNKKVEILAIYDELLDEDVETEVTDGCENKDTDCEEDKDVVKISRISYADDD